MNGVSITSKILSDFPLIKIPPLSSFISSSVVIASPYSLTSRYIISTAFNIQADFFIRMPATGLEAYRAILSYNFLTDIFDFSFSVNSVVEVAGVLVLCTAFQNVGVTHSLLLIRFRAFKVNPVLVTCIKYSSLRGPELEHCSESSEHDQKFQAHLQVVYEPSPPTRLGLWNGTGSLGKSLA